MASQTGVEPATFRLGELCGSVNPCQELICLAFYYQRLFLFPNLVQVPVDRSAHIRYTGLAFSFDSQTKNKATSEIWKPFRAPNLAHFYGLILQRTLVFISKWSSAPGGHRYPPGAPGGDR